MRRVRLFVVLTVVFALAAGPAVAADARGFPVLSVTLSDRTVVPGEETTLQVSVTNSGNVQDNAETNPRYAERVTTARGLTVSIEDGNAPIDVQTGPRAVGTLPEGTATVGFDVSVDEDADPGTYRIPVTTEYTYTRYISDNTQMDRHRTRTFTVTLEVEEDARLAVVNVSSGARIGSTGTVAVTVENTGTEVARDGALELTSRNADLHFGGSTTAQRAVGRLEPGERRTVAYETTVAPSAKRQPYAFGAALHYEDADGTAKTSETRTVAVTPQRQQTFAIESTESTVAVGTTGTVTVTMRNTGPVLASDATVRIAAASPDLSFAGSTEATRFVGKWAPNETRTLTYDVTATEEADTRSYSLDATVTYLDEEDDREEAPARSFGVTPAAEQNFSISDVSLTRYGNSAVLSAEVTNDGPRPVKDADILLRTGNGSVRPMEPTAPLGTLDPGETADVRFDLRVAPSANPGPRQFTALVRYDQGEDHDYRSDPLTVRTTLATDEDRIAVEPVEATFGIDTTNELRVRITNDGDEPLEDVHARLSALSPYTSETPSSYVASLAPGESAILTFEVTTPEDAVPTTDALAVNVTAETATDQSIDAGPYLVPVTIQAEESLAGGTTVFAALGVVLVVVLATGWWWLNR